MSDPNDPAWLLARERGEPIGHIPAARRETYRRLEGLVTSLPGEAPTAGWKERVLSAIDEAQPVTPRAPRGRPWQRYAVGASALVAAAVVIVVLVRRPGGPAASEPSLHTEVLPGTPPHRGDDVSIGDTLVVVGETFGPGELRVYGGAGDVLATCRDGAASAACQVRRDGERRQFRLEVPLRVRGPVRPILFTGAAMPAPAADLDGDLAAAARASIQTVTVAPVLVQ